MRAAPRTFSLYFVIKPMQGFLICPFDPVIGTLSPHHDLFSLNSLKYTMWMLRTPDQRVVGTIEYLLL
jgi:hypothetical protein